MSFDTLGLAEPLLRAVAEYGYTTPTPIQMQAIPAVLSGGDVMGGAQTGTGKTAGFVLPMLHRLMATPAVRDAKGRLPIRALILTPTRELAIQVAGLQQLGLHPQPLAEGLALPLTDGRTALTWGREVLRVPGLEARLTTLEDLIRAQGDQVAAKDQQLAATDRALAASEAETAAQHRRAEALQRAVNLAPRWRPTAVGLIAGLDETGTRRLGAYLSRTWGPVEVGALYLNRTAGVTAGIRF